MHFPSSRVKIRCIWGEIWFWWYWPVFLGVLCLSVYWAAVPSTSCVFAKQNIAGIWHTLLLHAGDRSRFGIWPGTGHFQWQEVRARVSTNDSFWLQYGKKLGLARTSWVLSQEKKRNGWSQVKKPYIWSICVAVSLCGLHLTFFITFFCDFWLLILLQGTLMQVNEDVLVPSTPRAIQCFGFPS